MSLVRFLYCCLSVLKFLQSLIHLEILVLFPHAYFRSYPILVLHFLWKTVILVASKIKGLVFIRNATLGWKLLTTLQCLKNIANPSERVEISYEILLRRTGFLIQLVWFHFDSPIWYIVHRRFDPLLYTPSLLIIFPNHQLWRHFLDKITAVKYVTNTKIRLREIYFLMFTRLENNVACILFDKQHFRNNNSFRYQKELKEK